MKLNQTAKRIVCLALSAVLLFGTVTPVFAATNETKKRDIFAEIIASIDITNKRIEKAVEIHLEENVNPTLVDTEELLSATDADVTDAIGTIAGVVADAEVKLEEGSANSTEALIVLNAIVDTQTVAQEVKESAKANLEKAQANLETAQKAYDEAVVISLDGAAEAKAQLDAATEAVKEAEAVFEAVTNKLTALEELVAAAATDVDAWKVESKNALAAAGTHLAESNAQLDAALKTLETENAEFVATVEAFQAQSEVFTEAVKVLATKVEVSQEKETALYALYAEYEAVLVAYENAMAAFEAEHGVEGLTYDDAVAIMEGLSDAVTEAQENVTLAEAAVVSVEEAVAAAQKNVDDTKANIETAQGELDAVKELVDVVANTDATVESAAVHTLAGLVIKNQLANGLTVEWNALDGQYGKSEAGFYVVLNENGAVSARYGYKLEDGVVNIYTMKSGEVTNYVTYNGVEYELVEAGNQFFINVNGVMTEVFKSVTNDVETYYVVETWTEDRTDVYSHQVVELTDLAPNALAVSYEGIDYDLASLTANVDGTYSTEILSVVKLIVSKNADATWTARVHAKECQLNHKHWVVNCSYGYVATDVTIPVTVSYPDKTQISYNNVWVDLATAEDGSLYIPTAEGNVSLVANTNALGIVESYAHHYTVDCSANVNLVFRAGGDADTFFEFGTKLNVNSNTLLALKENVLAGYNTDLENYLVALADAQTAKTNADNNLEAAKEALVTAEANYENAQATFDALTAANGAFAEKDLGALANLPKNFGEFITSANIDSLEDVTALVNAITVISNDKADAKEKLNAFVTLTQFIPMSDLVIPENYEDMNILEYAKFLYEFIKTDLGKALLEKDSFQHAYLMAWIDALTAKVEVLMAGIEVVEEAEKTITSGLEIIYAGAELSDASIETMIEKIKNEVLSGTVAALTIAVDVVEVSDEMVRAINEQVVILRFEAATAEAKLESAMAELEALQLQNPGGEALLEAEAKLEDAKTNYEVVAEKLVNLEASLEDAESYRAEAQAQYNALVEFETPAQPGEGEVELPTPEVDYVEPTPAPVVPEPVLPVQPVVTAPIVEEVVEAEVEEVVEEENVVTDNEITIEDVVEIVDEETPLADGVTDIVEEEVPLAANKEEEPAVAPIAAVAGTVTVAAGGAGFVFFRKRKFF